MDEEKKLPKSRVSRVTSKVTTKRGAVNGIFSKEIVQFNDWDHHRLYHEESPDKDLFNFSKEHFLKDLDSIKEEAIEELRLLGYEGWTDWCEQNRTSAGKDERLTARFADDVVRRVGSVRNAVENGDQWAALRKMVWVMQHYSNLKLSKLESDYVRGARHRLAHNRDYEKVILPEWEKERPNYKFDTTCDAEIGRRYGVAADTIKQQRRRYKNKIKSLP